MAKHPLPLPLWESPRQHCHAPGADNALFCGIVAFLLPLPAPAYSGPGYPVTLWAFRPSSPTQENNTTMPQSEQTSGFGNGLCRGVVAFKKRECRGHSTEAGKEQPRNMGKRSIP